MRTRPPEKPRPFLMPQRRGIILPRITPLQRKRHPVSARPHSPCTLELPHHPEPVRGLQNEVISSRNPHKRTHDSSRAIPRPRPGHDPLSGEAHLYFASQAISDDRIGTISPRRNAHPKEWRFGPNRTRPGRLPSSVFVLPLKQAIDEFRNPLGRTDPRFHLWT